MLKLIAHGKLPATTSADGGRTVDRQAAEAYHAQARERGRKALEELGRLSQEVGGYASDIPPPQPAVPPPVATGGLILYLDFDGVLHPENVYMQPGQGPYIESPEGHKLFEHAKGSLGGISVVQSLGRGKRYRRARWFAKAVIKES